MMLWLERVEDAMEGAAVKQSRRRGVEALKAHKSFANVLWCFMLVQ
jgi:hypothetical protein